MKGKLVIFSAPSGSGKTTIVRNLLERDLNLEFSISACSRPKRGNEVHGKDYYFFTISEFRKKIEDGAFAEWEEVYPDHLYGTLKSEIERIRNQEKNVIFDVDVKGGLNLKKLYREDALAIFVMPPSVSELEKRLVKRSTEDPEKIELRIRKAEKELAFAHDFDKIILNDQLDRAIEEAEKEIRDFLNH